MSVEKGKFLFALRLILLTLFFLPILSGGLSAEVTEDDPTIGGWPILDSEFPEVAAFEGEVDFYAFANFPGFKYELPDCRAWVRELEPRMSPGEEEGYVKVWSRDGECRFVMVLNPLGGWGQFLSFEGDRVSFAHPLDPEGSLFMTEVGVVKWVYLYEGNLLRFVYYYQAGSSLWSVDRMEYWPDTATPRYSYRYYDEGDLATGDWYNRTIYDESGQALDVEWRDGEDGAGAN